MISKAGDRPNHPRKMSRAEAAGLIEIEHAAGCQDTESGRGIEEIAIGCAPGAKRVER